MTDEKKKGPGRPRGRKIPVIKKTKGVKKNRPTPTDERKGFMRGALQNTTHRRSSKESTEIMRRVFRRIQALTLRAAGLPYTDIGKQLGISARTAYEDVHHCGAEFDAMAKETADGIRDVQNAQLDAVTRQVWPILSGQIAVPKMGGNRVTDRVPSSIEAVDQLNSTEEALAKLGISPRAPTPEDVADLKLKAVDRIIRISKRRSEINGTDMPVKIAHTDPTGTRPHSELSDEELTRELQALGVTNVLEAVVVEEEEPHDQSDDS